MSGVHARLPFVSSHVNSQSWLACWCLSLSLLPVSDRETLERVTERERERDIDRDREREKRKHLDIAPATWLGEQYGLATRLNTRQRGY